MTEEELDERITDQMDRERIRDAILDLEIKRMRETLEKAVREFER